MNYLVNFLECDKGNWCWRVELYWNPWIRYYSALNALSGGPAKTRKGKRNRPCVNIGIWGTMWKDVLLFYHDIGLPETTTQAPLKWKESLHCWVVTVRETWPNYAPRKHYSLLSSMYKKHVLIATFYLARSRTYRSKNSRLVYLGISLELWTRSVFPFWQVLGSMCWVLRSKLCL